MKEEEVIKKAIEWAEANGYSYIGKGKQNQQNLGSDIPVPGSERLVLIDGKAEKDGERLWIEAKGDNVGLSELLEGLARLQFAVFYGGGKGILAVGAESLEKVLRHRDFFKWFTEGVEVKYFNATEMRLVDLA